MKISYLKNLFSIAFGLSLCILILFVLGCEDDDDITRCPSGKYCDLDTPYSNQHSKYCYKNLDYCQQQTGYTCMRCTLPF